MRVPSHKGFTLVELVIVIIILAILSAVAIPHFLNLQQKARESVVTGFAGALRNAVALTKAKYQADVSVNGAGFTTASAAGCAWIDNIGPTMPLNAGQYIVSANGICVWMQGYNNDSFAYPMADATRYGIVSALAVSNQSQTLNYATTTQSSKAMYSYYTENSVTPNVIGASGDVLAFFAPTDITPTSATFCQAVYDAGSSSTLNASTGGVFISIYNSSGAPGC